MISSLSSPAINSHIHKIFPVNLRCVRAIFPGADLVWIEALQSTVNGHVVRINNNDLPQIILAGQIEHGINIIPANRYLVLVLHEACKAFPIGFRLERVQEEPDGLRDQIAGGLGGVESVAGAAVHTFDEGGDRAR